MTRTTERTWTADELLATFQPVFDRIAEGEAERERDRRLPHEQIEWLKEERFGALRVPPELGGYGADWATTTRLLVALATADSALPQALRGHFTLTDHYLFQHGTTGADGTVRDHSRWLERIGRGAIVSNAWTEPGVGSYVLNRTTATPDGDRWLVNGTKYYTTGSLYADYVDVLATSPEQRTVTAVVPRDQPGVVIEDDWDGFGQRLTASGTGVFTDAEVPAEDVFPFEERLPFQTAVYQQFLVAVQAGIAGAVLRDVAEQVRRRSRNFSHGNSELVRDDPQILQVVGEIGARSFAASAIAQASGAALDRAFASAGGTAEQLARACSDAELATASAQITVNDLVLASATQLFDTLGASSTSTRRNLDRHWRNARTVATHNPQVFKARIVGDHHVNGADATTLWTIGEARPRDGGTS